MPGGIKKTATLKRKMPLKRTSKLSKTIQPKTRKRVPLEKKTAQQLIKEADKWFSKYIRLRDCSFKDGQWVGTCISCNKNGIVAYLDDTDTLRFVKGWDAGHFISRGIHQLRFHEMNVNLQCSMHCNRMKSGNVERQKPALDLKYGDDTWRMLEEMAQEEGSRKMLPKTEYLQIIAEAKSEVEEIRNLYA